MEHDQAMQMLKSIATGFDQHDLEGILAHFADDADNATSVVMAPDPLREERDLEQLARITP